MFTLHSIFYRVDFVQKRSENLLPCEQWSLQGRMLQYEERKNKGEQPLLSSIASSIEPPSNATSTQPQRSSAHDGWEPISTQSSSARKEIPGARLSLIGFCKKQWKCFWLVHSSLHKSRFFPRNVEVNTTGRFLISAIPKHYLHD